MYLIVKKAFRKIKKGNGFYGGMVNLYVTIAVIVLFLVVLLLLYSKYKIGKIQSHAKKKGEGWA